MKVIGLSANELGSHERWIKDINEFGATTAPNEITDVKFPIVSRAESFVIRQARLSIELSCAL